MVFDDIVAPAYNLPTFSNLREAERYQQRINIKGQHNGCERRVIFAHEIAADGKRTFIVSSIPAFYER